MILSDPNCTLCHGYGTTIEDDRTRLCGCAVRADAARLAGLNNLVDAILKGDAGRLRRLARDASGQAFMAYHARLRDIAALRRVGTAIIRQQHARRAQEVHP